MTYDICIQPLDESWTSSTISNVGDDMLARRTFERKLSSCACACVAACLWM